MDLLLADEEVNMRKFVEVAQAGAAAIWQDKQDRLAYLLAKRQKEHEDRYNVTPLLVLTPTRASRYYKT